jgi:hypothetical protein
VIVSVYGEEDPETPVTSTTSGAPADPWAMLLPQSRSRVYGGAVVPLGFEGQFRDAGLCGICMLVAPAVMAAYKAVGAAGDE